MPKKLRQLTPDEVSYFCYQTAVIVDSGVPLFDGLTVMAAEIREKSSPEAAALLQSITDSLSMEKPFYAALEDTGAFPDFCIMTVRAGELSGRLDEALRQLSEHYEREARLAEKLRAAVVSPLVMLAVTAVVIAALTLKVLPMFAEIFSDFDPEIYSVIGRSVQISSAAGMVMLIICGVIFLGAAVFFILGKICGKSFAARFAAKFPLTKEISRIIGSARFAGAVSMMISSGISPAEALENVKGISSDSRVNEKISQCASLVLNDVPFSDALERTGLLPVFYSQTLRISYASGSFEAAWQKISSRLSEEAEARVNAVIDSAEPALTVLLTAAAGVLMLTVLIPMINIMSSIG